MTTLARRTFLTGAAALAYAPKKRIVFVAGVKTHGYGEHAHNAGCLLLAKCLNESLPGVEAVVTQNGWPADEAIFDGANSLVVFADGGDENPMLPHLETIDRLMKKGAGLAVLHYALIVPKGEAGDRLISWIGGYYETHWSVNPVWTAQFSSFPKHPAARGVKPFTIRDEWYYHMRFGEGMKGVTPLLTSTPPDSTREKEFGPHSGNAVVLAEKGKAEHVAWLYDRPGAGLGFGYTGGHYHWGWGDDDIRRVVLNGIAWTAGVEIPKGGIQSSTPTWDELLANQEGEKPAGFSREKAQEAIHPRAK